MGAWEMVGRWKQPCKQIKGSYKNRHFSFDHYFSPKNFLSGRGTPPAPPLRVQRPVGSEHRVSKNGRHHHTKTPIPVPVIWVAPAANHTTDVPTTIVERAAANHTMNISILDLFKFCFGIKGILFIFAARPFPNIAAHVGTTIRRI